MTEKGKIKPDYYVSCGICNDCAVGLGRNHKEAIETARQHYEYKLTRKYGWVCSRCYPEIKKAGKE